MVKNNADMRVRIQAELDSLVSFLDGDTEKINEIVAHFIIDTPVQFQQIKESIANENWKNVAALIHKIKIRYSYLGLNDIFSELTAWEGELSFSPDKSVHERYWNNFQSTSDLVLKELRETTYYKKTDLGTAAPLSGKTILVAEDDMINVLVFELFIKELGGEVIRATDGHEAVKLAMEKHPDFIFMDIHMPNFSGIDAIKELRRINFNCPIVSLSASTKVDERDESIKAGANEFIIKPASRQAITQTLLKYLGSGGPGIL